MISRYMLIAYLPHGQYMDIRAEVFIISMNCYKLKTLGLVKQMNLVSV